MKQHAYDKWLEAPYHDNEMDDIDKETVDFQFNFDDSLEEPTVLPTRVPHLLINGSSGIAVGMATNMLPHNLSEVIDGCIAYVDNREITIDELMQHVKAPDFPGGGLIYGMEGIPESDIRDHEAQKQGSFLRSSFI
jgi:DNA gyrase subunit A